MTTIPFAGISDPFSSLSHLFGAVAGMVSSFFLIAKSRRSSAGRQLSLYIYSFCLVFLFSMSGVFHMLERNTDARYVFRILDYCAIFLMIAGSFTPLHIILFRGMKRWLILIVVWAVAISGLTVTSLFFDQIPQWLSYSLYLGLGWVGYFSFRYIYSHKKRFAAYLAAGGAFYTIGAIIDFVRVPDIIPGVFGHHEIFHICVILGALAHWMLIYKIADYQREKSIA